MPHPYETLVTEWLAAGDAGELARFGEYLHDHVIVHAPLGLSTTSIREEQDVWARALAAIRDLRHEVQETFVSDSGVVARVVVTGTVIGEFGGLSAVGRSFTVDQAVVLHIRDGKAYEVWEIVDSGAIRDQVSERPASSGSVRPEGVNGESLPH
jgi:predicted ester cyclase